jgi:ribonuclease P protein component
VLPAANRLRLRQDFTVVYAKGDRYYGNFLKLRIYNTHNLKVQTQIGIVVSKKVSKKAVIRNQIRRQLRAIFRAFLPQLKQGLQIVVTVSSISNYHELREDLTSLLFKARSLHIP